MCEGERVKNYLYLTLSQYRFFWSLQKQIKKYVFKAKSMLFYIKRLTEEGQETFQTYKNFTKFGFLNIFLIILGTYILQLANSYFEIIIKAMLHGYITPNFVSFKMNSIANAEYITFLTAIAAIGGVFIALHFSSLAATNATLYSTFSNNLRDLVYRDKISDSYIKFLSKTTFFAFTLIVFFLLGYEKIYISIPIMLFLIGITIFSYFNLGNRMHKLLSVDTLSVSIFLNLYKYIQNAVQKDMYYQDRNFQNHYFTLASQELRLLSSLLDTSLSKYKIHNDSLQNISLSILKLLIDYQNKKRLIPYESLWYKQTQEYKDLYKMGNFSGLDIFLRSATMPQGDTKYDLFWVEDKLLPYIIKILIHKIENNEIEDYQNILYRLNQYLSYLVQLGNVKYAVKIINKFKKDFFGSNVLNSLNRFELTQYIYSLPLSIILNFYHSINAYSYSHVSHIVNNNSLLKDDSQYKFQENTIETLNWLQKRLKIEYEAENREISPKWYQAEILMLTISKCFIENIETINNLLNSFFDKELEEKDLQLYTIMLTQKWETINKYIFQFYKVEEILNEYTKERKIDGLDWKNFSIKKFKNQNILLRKECILEIGKVLPSIRKRKDKNFPDIFGYLLRLTSDNLLELAMEKNFSDLKEIYESFFISSFTKYEDLKPKFDESIDKLDYRKRNEFIISFRPIIDLIEITGLIKIIFEFYNEDETWSFTEELWLQLLNNELLFMNAKFIALIISMTEAEFGIPIGDDQRFNWNNRVNDFFKNNIIRKSFIDESTNKYSFIHSENIALHESALIREYIGDEKYGNSIDGIDIFIYSLLNKNFKDKNLKFGWKRNNKNFEDSMKRNTEIYEKYKNAKK